MVGELSFAVWGAFLSMITLLVVYFDDDRVHRPAYVMAGVGVCGLLYASNRLGEELCGRPECRPVAKSNINFWLTSISLVGAGLLWFELTA